MTNQSAGQSKGFKRDVEHSDTAANQNMRLAQYDGPLAAQRAMLALDAGRMGSWCFDMVSQTVTGDPFVAQLLQLNYDAQPWPAEQVYASMHPDDLAMVQAEVEKAMAGADNYEVIFRNRVVNTETGHEGLTWLGARGRITKRDENGEAIELIGVNWDATEQMEQEQQLRLLAAEMDHRIKNAFAIVQSLINVGRRTADDTVSFADTLRHQVQAMADTHALSARLARQADATQDVPVTDVLRQALKPWLDGHAKLDDDVTVTLKIKDEIVVAPTQISAFAMIIYELTTNATKYGTLGCHKGRLDVEIKENKDGGFCFDWSETMDMSKSETDARKQWSKGFGSTLIDYCVRTLDAEMKRDISANGVSYQLTVPA